MEHTYYRIGEVSRVTGISKDTLHFYNKIGLLVPDYIDPDNQYRYSDGPAHADPARFSGWGQAACFHADNHV